MEISLSDKWTTKMVMVGKAAVAVRSRTLAQEMALFATRTFAMLSYIIFGS